MRRPGGCVDAVCNVGRATGLNIAPHPHPTLHIPWRHWNTVSHWINNAMVRHKAGARRAAQNHWVNEGGGGDGGGGRVWYNEMHFIPSQSQLKKDVSNF